MVPAADGQPARPPTKSLRVGSSPQGYDIRYTTSPTAPEEFQLYTGPIPWVGVHEYRAVCTPELYSDEMTVRYIVTLPRRSRPSPTCSRAATRRGRCA